VHEETKQEQSPVRSSYQRFESAPAATAEDNSIETAIAAKAEKLDIVLTKLKKNDLTEIKSLNNPSVHVKSCMEAVCILLGFPGEPTW